MKPKRLLFYLLVPLIVVLAMIGFPLPVAAREKIKPSQEQSTPADKRN